MKKENVIRTIVVVFILVLLVAGYYVMLSVRDNKKKNAQEEARTEEAKELLQTDLKKSYPLTPTAVVSYYSDLVLTYYDDDCTSEMRKELMKQSRLLYDDELLENNEEEQQLLLLEADVAAYKEDKKQIINYTICEPEEVQYGSLDGDKMATVTISYRIREKNNLIDIEEEFFLRKDSKDNWKILGWQLQKNSSKDSKE